MRGPPCRPRHVAIESSAGAALWRPYRAPWPKDCCHCVAWSVGRGWTDWLHLQAAGAYRNRPVVIPWVPKAGPRRVCTLAAWWPRPAPIPWTMRTASIMHSTSPRCTRLLVEDTTMRRQHVALMDVSRNRTVCTRWARPDRRVPRSLATRTTPRRLPYRAAVPARQPRRQRRLQSVPIIWRRHRPAHTIIIISTSTSSISIRWSRPRAHPRVPALARCRREIRAHIIHIMAVVPVAARELCHASRCTLWAIPPPHLHPAAAALAAAAAVAAWRPRPHIPIRDGGTWRAACWIYRIDCHPSRSFAVQPKCHILRRCMSAIRVFGGLILCSMGSSN